MKTRGGRGGFVLSLALVLVAAALPPFVAQVGAQMAEPVDYDAIYKIKEEGMSRSQVMDIMSWLTDVSGPRVTGSPQIKAAADWAVKKMTSWGLANPRLEPWKVIDRATGKEAAFGRGWSNDRFYMQVTAPVPFPVIGYAKVWTPGTSGPVSGEAVLAPIATEADIEKYRGKLKGKFVLSATMRVVAESKESLSTRYTAQQLEELAAQPVPVTRAGGPAGPIGAFGAAAQLQGRIARLLQEEGALAWIEFGAGDGGTVFVGGGAQRNAAATDPAVPRVSIAIEHYGRIYRMLQKDIAVTIEANVQNTFYDNPPLFNVVAELPGTDKADEVVMLGAHFDSWHAGTGATDNAAGSAVMMEAIRILKASGVKLRRTVRIGLWTGEEQGLLGSRWYVRDHFAEPVGEKWTLKPEHAKLAGYFNVDNGTGKIRGVYQQGNEAVAPIFRAWMAPFDNLGMNTLTIRNTGGTDHLSFDGVGLPGFQFIQDELEYDSRTHHSNMDVYERIQEADMKQMAVIVASFVYHTANRAQALPRKPMPPVPPPPGQGGRPQ